MKPLRVTAITIGVVLVYLTWPEIHDLAAPLPPPPPQYDGCDNCSELARDAAWSMDKEPWRWHEDGFSVWRDYDIFQPSFWVANEAWCLGPEPNEMSWGCSEPGTYDQQLVWRAYFRWHNRKIQHYFKH